MSGKVYSPQAPLSPGGDERASTEPHEEGEEMGRSELSGRVQAPALPAGSCLGPSAPQEERTQKGRAFLERLLKYP